MANRRGLASGVHATYATLGQRLDKRQILHASTPGYDELGDELSKIGR